MAARTPAMSSAPRALAPRPARPVPGRPAGRRPSARLAGRQADKRRRIVEAASVVFAARPFHLASMDDVASAAAVGKGTLYRYFPSKDDLHLALVEEAFDLLVARLEREGDPGLAPVAALRRMIEAIVDTFARHLPFFRLLQEGEARLVLRRRQAIRLRRERIARLLAEVLERGAASGELRAVDPVLGPAMLIGMVWGTTLNHAHELPAALLAERVTDLSLHGLLAGPGRPG
jgi:AcrR family transcriptional regulator